MNAPLFGSIISDPEKEVLVVLWDNGFKSRHYCLNLKWVGNKKDRVKLVEGSLEDYKHCRLPNCRNLIGPFSKSELCWLHHGYFPCSTPGCKNYCSGKGTDVCRVCRNQRPRKLPSKLILEMRKPKVKVKCFDSQLDWDKLKKEGKRAMSYTVLSVRSDNLDKDPVQVFKEE